MERIFAIGDIHGCITMLEELVALLPLDKDADRLLFIGDYIDRGMHSKEVVDCIIDLKQRCKRVTCLLGNHEEMLMNYIEGQDKEAEYVFLRNGGTATVLSYGYRDDGNDRIIDVPPPHLEFFETLLPLYETDDYIFAHAGLRPGTDPAGQDRSDLLWIRGEFIHSSYDFGKTVVFGHTPFASPLLEDDKIGIDTGAVYGGNLTCIELPSRKIYQV
ncbi:MAG: serine/threonine protein phosphatase [Syntrophales bacterium]|jgi:serine/threonine protein phosphatase 1|nr:serine/threonine protein phosphatase [Syntrophales bacterium]